MVHILDIIPFSPHISDISFVIVASISSVIYLTKKKSTVFCYLIEARARK